MNRLPIVLPGALALALLAPPASAQSSFQHSARALTYSVNAIGEAFLGSAKLVSAVAAVPLGAVAGIGEVSGEMSDALLDAANAPVGAALPVAEETITAGPPPSEVMKREEGRPWPGRDGGSRPR